MSKQGQEAAMAKLQGRRHEIRRALMAVEQEIRRTSRQVQVIQQQIASLNKGHRKAA
jgi:hypothetical protein